LKVVCDSTALIGLAKIDKVDLLKQIFTDVYIPEAVFNEVVSRGIERPGTKEIDNADWIKTVGVKDKRTIQILIAEIGRGEAETLVLGKN